MLLVGVLRRLHPLALRFTRLDDAYGHVDLAVREGWTMESGNVLLVQEPGNQHELGGYLAVVGWVEDDARADDVRVIILLLCFVREGVVAGGQRQLAREHEIGVVGVCG